MRASDVMLQASILELPEVESPEELRKLRFPNIADNNVHLASGGPLVRFGITTIKSTGSAALMMLAHHSTFDAMSLGAFHRGLEANIQAGGDSEPYTSYKLFADTLYQHCSAVPAQLSIRFHMDRLRGIGSLRESAGRQWPFLDESIAEHLPNPVTIAGNTLSIVMNRIRIDANATVGNFLAHLEEEQELLTRHAHAPMAAISAQLNRRDAAAFYAGRRQMLNWNPIMADRAAAQGSKEIELLHFEGFSELMLEWHCGVMGSNAVLTTRWDGAQFGKATVEKWADGFMVALEWVARIGNWHEKLGALDWRVPAATICYLGASPKQLDHNIAAIPLPQNLFELLTRPHKEYGIIQKELA
ncbi:MAG: hypothetical protein Q9171_000230 [Xanthocarpia ochracea]